MPPAVEELPTGESPRSGRSQGVYDRQLRRRVCKIDFAQLGASAREPTKSCARPKTRWSASWSSRRSATGCT
jgi:hypothetical protein